jgi:hypothetical protein
VGGAGRRLFFAMASKPSEPPPAWSIRLLSELDAADERAIALAGTLTPQELNWRRSPPEWSVGQCLEHLCVANEVYTRAMAPSLAGRPAAVVQEITPGWFGRWFIRSYIEPSPTTKRAPSPKKIRPAAQVEPSVLDRFLASNRAARELIRSAAQHDVNRIRFPNPFVPLIHFTVGTGLEILTRHERRHLLQAERVRDSMRSVPSATRSS